MRIRLWTALGAAILAGSVFSPTTNARAPGGRPSRPVILFRGFNSCHVGPFCRQRPVSSASSVRFGARFLGTRTGGGTFAGGPSDDYAVDADEGFGTDDAFRFDKRAAFGSGEAYPAAMPESPDSFDPDSR
jgi:hypothetical protein